MLFADAAALVANDARFLDINRGVVVNMDHVAAVKDANVLMSDGRRLPLRKRDRAALARAISQHMVSRMGRKTAWIATWHRLPESDRPGHGIGLRSVASIAKRYGGSVEARAENGEFFAGVMLYHAPTETH